MRQKLFIICILFSFFISTFAQQQSTQINKKTVPSYALLVQEIVDSFSHVYHYPGWSYAIIYKGQLLLNGYGGYANIDNHILVDDSTDFCIASMTKSFTALSILQLRDQGKLQLDDPINKYIPYIKCMFKGKQASNTITIRMLLTHTAGLPEDNPWGDRQMSKSEGDLRKLLRNGISLSHIPGTYFEYSNLGFTILGLLIHQISHQYYQQYIKQHILLPLNMDETYWQYTQVPPHHLALGYYYTHQQEELQPNEKVGIYGAMGGLITSVSDFSKYMSEYLSNSSSIIKPSSLLEMQQPWHFDRLESTLPCPTSYAYGYGLRWAMDCKNILRIYHTGGLPGYGAAWEILPQYGLGMVMFTNGRYTPVYKINRYITDTLITLLHLQPIEPKPTAVLEEMKQTLLHILPSWDSINMYQQYFSENFFLDHPLSDYKDISTRLFNQLHGIKTIGEMHAENTLRGYFIIEGKSGIKIKIYFTLDPQNPPTIQYLSVEKIND